MLSIPCNLVQLKVICAVSRMLYSKRQQHIATTATSTTRPSQLARQARLDEHIRRDMQLSLFCNVYKVMIIIIFFNK